MGTNFRRHSPKAEIQSKKEDILGNEGGNGYVLIPSKYLFATTGIESPAPVVGELSATPWLVFPRCAGTSPSGLPAVCETPTADCSPEPCPTSHVVLHTSHSWLILWDYSCFRMLPMFLGNRGALCSEDGFLWDFFQCGPSTGSCWWKLYWHTEALFLYKPPLFSSSALPGAWNIHQQTKLYQTPVRKQWD